jgi:hypothetical protein
MLLLMRITRTHEQTCIPCQIPCFVGKDDDIVKSIAAFASAGSLMTEHMPHLGICPQAAHISVTILFVKHQLCLQPAWPGCGVG